MAISNLAADFREFRWKSKLTVSGLSRVSGVSVQVIEDLESGGLDIEITDLFSLLEALAVDVGEYLSFEQEAPALALVPLSVKPTSTSELALSQWRRKKFRSIIRKAQQRRIYLTAEREKIMTKARTYMC